MTVKVLAEIFLAALVIAKGLFEFFDKFANRIYTIEVNVEDSDEKYEAVYYGQRPKILHPATLEEVKWSKTDQRRVAHLVVDKELVGTFIDELKALNFVVVKKR